MAETDVILTPDQRVRVFISSTLGELAVERVAARRAIRRLHLVPVWCEPGACPHPPRSMYRPYLEQSQVFVGIYGQQYGWVAPGMEISGLEDEYRLAAGKPMLLYVKRPASDQEPRLAAMIDGIRAAGTVSCRAFATARELEQLLADDLAVLLGESFAGAPAGAGAPRPSAAGAGESAGVELPAGTVTFLFTDIEGSTRRWEAVPDAMGRSLALHNETLRAAFAHYSGVVYSTMGDGMVVAFASAAGAARAVLEAQRALLEAPWPDQTGVLKVRMGLHTDEAVLRGGQYANRPLNRCARLMAAAHGGQVLLSGATAALVRSELPDGASLIDLGEHRLRDVADRMRIFQLAHPDLPRALAAGCWRPSVRSWPSGCPLGPMPPRFSVGTPAITGRWSGGRTGRYAASARVSGWSGGRPRRGTWPPRCTGIWPTSRRRCRTCSASCGRSGTCGTVRPTPAPGSRNCCPPPYRWTPQARAELEWAATVTANEVGDDAAALAARRRLEPLLEEIQDSFLRGICHLGIAWTSPITGELEGALRELSASLEELRGQEEPFYTALAAFTAGAAEIALDRPDGALQHLRVMRELADRFGYTWLTASARLQLGTLAIMQGRPDQARELLDEALDLSLEIRIIRNVTLCLAAFAQLAFAEGDPGRAALLAGAAEGLRRRAGFSTWPMLRRGETQLAAQIRQALGDDRFGQALAAGSRLTQQEAVAAIRDRPSDHTQPS